MNDLLVDHADMLFVDLPIALPYIESGKLIALALASEKRAPMLPNLPTTVEAGYPKLLGDNWYGLLAPAGTPQEIIVKLHQAVVTALKMPDMQAQFAKLGALPVGNTPQEFAALLRSETVRLGPLAKSVGAKWE